MEVSQYMDVFLEESREHLQAINDHILLLEKDTKNMNLVNEIFRSAHTLKGMSATMGFEDIASLTHKMENVLDLIRNDELDVTSEVVDIIFDAIELLEIMVEDIRMGSDEKRDISELLNRLDRIENGDAAAGLAAQSQTEETDAAELDEYQRTIIEQAIKQGYSVYRIAVEVAETCMLKGARSYMVFELLEDKGEIIKTSPATEEIEEGNFDRGFELIYLTTQTPESLKPALLSISEITKAEFNEVDIQLEDNQPEEKAEVEAAATKQPKKESSAKVQKVQRQPMTIRVNLDRVDELLNLFEEVVIDQSRMNVISRELKNTQLIETVEHMNRVAADMQDLILAIRMVPIDQVFNRFPRMVRGLARDLNKKINLKIVGEETELDRTVIDEIGDPLVHLIRNSVDHGIESPEKRKANGKPEEGQITLRAYQSGNHVFIEIEDDGNGINVEKVKKKAIENGILTAEEAERLSNDEVNNLIFASGFSTAENVSDVSGRGVGLDVVNTKIESLGGQISIESEEGKGSMFSIQLPLTLSILSTLLVKCGEETYAVPLSSITETVLLDEEELLTAHGQKVMNFRGKVVPLLELRKIFRINDEEEKDKNKHAVVVLRKGEKLTGIVVDHFIGQSELVLKSLGAYLGDVFGISGATILGDGRVALIIDPNALIK